MTRGLGHFVAVEGPDGSGKSTLCCALLHYLVGQVGPVHRTCEPSEGPVGRQIRRVLRGEDPRPSPERMMRLFAADRLHHLAIEVEPALEWALVLCDRYVLSSYAYQHGVDGVPAEEVRRANAGARPADLTIVLQAPVEVCVRRIVGAGRETLDFYDVEEAIAKQVEVYCRARDFLPDQRVALVDAAQPERAVLVDALDHVLELVGR